MPTSIEDATATFNYLSSFPYRIYVQGGPVYSTRFKEFHQYCVDTLGIKYKDWYILSVDINVYALLLKDNKHSMFLVLKFSDIVSEFDTPRD
jgi:hypothetical protein